MSDLDKKKRLEYIDSKISFIEKIQRGCANEVYEGIREEKYAKLEIAEHQKELDSLIKEQHNIKLDKQQEFSSKNEELIFQEKLKEEAVEKEAEARQIEQTDKQKKQQQIQETAARLKKEREEHQRAHGLDDEFER